MSEEKRPDYADGKVCYIMIPANDVTVSADFYSRCFGWRIRKDNHGNASFDDTVGQVSGMWITDARPHVDSGLRIHIMVADIVKSCDAVTANGGEVITPFDLDASEVTAEFSDPAGNIFGLYQEKALAKKL
jgi:hypothetical protein